MDVSKVASELAGGGAYTAWFIAVTLSGVVVYLYKETRKAYDQVVEAYKATDGEVLSNTNSIIKAQMETTMTLSLILRILEGRK